MAERKNLTITQVNEIQKVGNKQIPKLSFRARENDNELAGMYFTFKSSLFELIKEGQTITADVETSTREWEGNTYTDRKITQVYVDGQPVSGKSQYRGKSPEELEQQARLMILAYAKDLAVADKIPLNDITKTADWFYTWLTVNDKVASPAMTPHSESSELQHESSTPTGKKIQNITELKSLLMKHKIPTTEAYEILSINRFMDLVDLDEAWDKIKKVKGIK